MILNFCLIGNIRHNFLVPRIIESAPKTFMPIQTPDLDRVVSNAKGNLAKSNKSELWNRLSYRGLPYLFEVRSQTLFYDFQKFEVAASKFRG